eukprot:Gregarina_sp_Poly_1__4606@NODE_2467_length_2082_cov_217_117122_g1562_i0_p2_GENE_NODE_2467_length_2082_cov_217_117122_g1562_i0NODE_2467_length_2082_cov_217_117122_g1562_i0_p2_ORF_typecomplete_len199_score21_20DUF373/PF04123_13/5_7AmpE/PF17113_5/0_17AmpE/PF17113_5/2_1e02_NODE_2467_length_2082_cov_217_117122_g1562_i05151111
MNAMGTVENPVKEEPYYVPGSMGAAGEEAPSARVLAKPRSSDGETAAGRLRLWIEHGGNSQMLVIAATPAALLLLFPVLVALRLLVLLFLPLSCLIPVYMIMKGVVLVHVHKTVKAGLILTYLGILAFCVVPYLFVWPFYGFLEIFPACVMTIPILLASLPLAVCGCVGGTILWFLSGSDYYSHHSYHMASSFGDKKI